MDLEAACRQLAVRPSHAHLSVICLKNPESGRAEFFKVCAMPFGATAAVHASHRLAIALETIVTKIFGIPCTHYFDDFTFIVPSTLGQELIEIVEEGLAFLGWRVKGGSKDVLLNKTSGALGVTFDLSQVFGPKPFLSVQ